MYLMKKKMPKVGDYMIGGAIVKDTQGKVVGIFTTVDACRVLKEVLETVYA